MSRRALALTPAEARSSPPDRPEDDLPTRSVLAAAALALLIAAALLALVAGLGLLAASAVFHSGGLG